MLLKEVQFVVLLYVLFLSNKFAFGKVKLFPGDGVEGNHQFKESEIDEEIERLKATEFKDLKKIEETRNKAWGCYYLVKNRLLTSDSKIANMVKNGTFSDKVRVEKFFASEWFQNCLGRITTEDGQAILDNLANEKKFELSLYDHTLGFSEDFVNRTDFELDQFHALIFNYYEDLDNQVRRINGEEENYFSRKYDIEPKLGWISFSKLDSTTKMSIFLGISSLIIAFFYFAYKKLFTPQKSAFEEAKSKKKKKKSVNEKKD